MDKWDPSPGQLGWQHRITNKVGILTYSVVRMADRYPRRDKVHHDYAMLNTLGTTQEVVEESSEEGESGKGMAGGKCEVTELSSGDPGQVRLDLVDRPVTGDLTDNLVWEQVKAEHDNDCEVKQKERLLAEQQCYLMEKRRSWIENDRKIKLLVQKAKDLDEQEDLKNT